jgi:hypothetical protein
MYISYVHAVGVYAQIYVKYICVLVLTGKDKEHYKAAVHTCTIFQYGVILARLSVTSEQAVPSSIIIRVDWVYRA